MKKRKMDVLSEVAGDSLGEKFQNVWQRLQTRVNVIVDSDLDRLNRSSMVGQPGVKQLLESKQVCLFIASLWSSWSSQWSSG